MKNIALTLICALPIALAACAHQPSCCKKEGMCPKKHGEMKCEGKKGECMKKGHHKG